MKAGFQPPLRVAGFIATRRGDPERGPLIRLSPLEAKLRMLQDGELAWVHGPRRNELAVVVIDEAVPDGGVVARDIAGITIVDSVRITKPDLDSRRDRQVG
ncbi:MAG: hypothetical protein H0W69_05415 [Gemmatimonadaceae bacterium]|nr:hypothetical protein [Gemmatimonadaceae bacterium]